LKAKSLSKELYFEAVTILTNATKHFPNIPHTTSSLFHMWDFAQCPPSRNPRIWIVYTLPKKNCKKIIFVTTIFRGLNVLMPNQMDNQSDTKLQFNLDTFSACCIQVHKAKYSMDMQYLS
jgi:hypothetical protein